MAISPADSQIFGANFNHPAIASVFSDERYVQYMLSVERALAAVLAEAQLIPETAAREIEAAAETLEVDLERLGRGTEQAGFPVIELVRQLREQVGDPAANYVHWGSTTQDIMDTARALQIREALQALQTDLHSIIDGLVRICQDQRLQVMAGRTHALQALPITFGYKAATWLAPLVRHARRLEELRPRVLVIQFGAAAGTLAPYGEAGPDLYRAFARELGLHEPSMPWHTQRDSLVELGAWLSGLSGSLGKMAQDVILMSQTEVSEVSEQAGEGHGGSSTLPHKQNPIHSEVVLVAARANAAAISALYQALIQEHERGTHGAQLEWLYLPQMFALSGAALTKAATITQNLQTHPDRMRANIEASQDLILTEPIKFALLDVMDVGAAEDLLERASRRAVEEKRSLIHIVREQVDADLDWDRLADPAEYLGATEWFIDRVVDEAQRATQSWARTSKPAPAEG